MRQRAGELLGLINDPQRLQMEREKARQNRDKYKGVSSTQVRAT